MSPFYPGIVGENKYLFPCFCFYCQQKSSIKEGITKRSFLLKKGPNYCSFASWCYQENYMYFTLFKLLVINFIVTT